MRSAPLTLERWTRRGLRSLFAPLLVLGLIVVASAIATTTLTYRRNVATLEAVARDDATRVARAERRRLEAQLLGLSQLVGVLASRTRAAFDTPFEPPSDAMVHWKDWGDGSWRSDGPVLGGSVYWSGITPLDAAQQRKTRQLMQLLPTLRDVQRASPAVVQAYLNTPESLNLISPVMDASQYPPKMDIPSYNFFYEADAQHNPKREPVFTDAYLDPAGAGWIISAIAPVYRDDRLLGVVGLDVTLSRMIDEVMQLEVPWGGYGLLVDRQGTLLAVPPAAEDDLGLRELRSHRYDGSVGQDTLKPEAFGLKNHPTLAPLGAFIDSAPEGITSVNVGAPRLISWSTVPGTGWHLLVVLPQQEVFASAEQLRDDMTRQAITFTIGLALFTALFLLWSYRASRQQVGFASEPLARARQMTDAIARGEYRQTPPRADIVELDETLQAIARMGAQLADNLADLQKRDAALTEARASEASARAAAQARSAFLANMSHEIRTPLNGVLGMLELVLLTEPESERRRTLETAWRSGRALLGIINDVLDASKIDSGSMQIEATPFDLRSLLGEVRELFTPTARAKGLDLVLDVSGAPEGVRGDPTRLRQVLSNLLSNAIKFTLQGSVTLTVRTAAPGRVHFVVKDTGIGIPRERQAAVFNRFTQADESTTRRFGGTGLGLSISSSLVSLMGGTLGLESEPGVGTSMFFTLPLEPARVSSPRATEQLAQVSRPLKVLAAEDNPVNQLVLRRMLERLGHELVLVDNGRSALDRAVEERFDVAIFDVHMPQLDGLELTRSVRANHARRDRLPILGLTASAMSDDVARCLEAGMDDVLTKPYTLLDLDKRLRTLTAPEGAAVLQAESSTPVPQPAP